MRKRHTVTPAAQADDGIAELPDGEHRVFIESTTHTVRRLSGVGDYHEVRVLVGSMDSDGRVFQAEKTFALSSASGVAEMRRYFALFDFPVLDAGELDEACERARFALLRVRMSTREDGTRAMEVVERIWKEEDPQEWFDGADIWDHRLRWRKRQEFVKARDALKAHR